MRLANFMVDGSTHLGVLLAGGVLDLTAASESISTKLPTSVEEALQNWGYALLQIQSSLKLISSAPDFSPKSLRRADTVKFAPPVRNPSKILCVYVNYRSHGQEVGSIPTEPVFFFKHPNCIIGDGDDVLVPKYSTRPDHEVELGLVIGKKGKDIKASQAYDHVAGYTVFNDISFRDAMKRGVEGTTLGRNLYKAKVADTSLPMGPFLVSREEIPNPYPLKLTLKVNGEVRQKGVTDDMIFKVPELVASASEDNTLLPGDVISTGTCSGVGLYTGKYLKDGDLIEAEVEKVGVLRNKVKTQ
ncbi:MAG TPA: fumarylacetoacetate hydrolase family protein [Nitrososphaerales archaeon]|nr:fumarylacetoacetate hydrolase family protein [Nitrososphaerales archaeon]